MKFGDLELNKAASIGLVLVFAAASSGCVHSHRTATATSGLLGELVHTEAGSGTLWIKHDGKRYSGRYQWQPSNWIQGKRRYHAGRVARATLVESGGDTLFCDIQWGPGITPAGYCEDSRGHPFHVQFD